MKPLSLMFVLAMLLPRPARADPAAILMGVTGTAQVRSTAVSDWRSAPPGMALQTGDQVVVRSGQATVLLADGRLERLAEGVPFSVGASSRPKAAGGTLQRLWDALVRRAQQAAGARKMFSEPAAVRGRRHGRLEILSPRNTVLLAPPDRIRWNAGAGAVAIDVTDPDGRLVWSGRQTGSEAVLPLDRLQLVPGTFYFVQASSLPGKSSDNEKTFFRFITPAQREQLSRDLAAVDGALGSRAGPESLALARATIFERHGLLEEAAAVYRGLGGAKNATAAAGLEWVETLGGRRQLATR